jgi:hypothetical protein
MAAGIFFVFFVVEIAWPEQFIPTCQPGTRTLSLPESGATVAIPM